MQNKNILSIFWTCYDYIYFVAYRIECKILSKKSSFTPSEVAVGLFTASQMLEIALMQKLFFFVSGIIDERSKPTILVFGIFVSLPIYYFNYCRFEKKKGYLDVEKKYSNEKPINKIFARIGASLFILLPWIAYGYHSFRKLLHLP